MNMYAVTMRHDRETITIATSGTDAEDAIQSVLRAELAPRSAVVGVKPVEG